MDLQIREQRVEALLVGGGHLEANVARVDRGGADVELDDPVGGAGVDDRVEHLREQQRVDDMPVEAHDLAGDLRPRSSPLPFARRCLVLRLARTRLRLTRRLIRPPMTNPWRMVFSEIDLRIGELEQVVGPAGFGADT